MKYNSFPYLSVPPTAEVISEDDARKWLRLDTGVTDLDTDIIKALVQSAVDNFQKRTYIKQLAEATWEWIVECFPVNIPIEPNIHDIVISYKTDLTDNAWTVLDNTKYQFFKTGECSNEIVYLETPPTVARVKVVFKLGYANVADIPKDYFRPIRAVLGEDFDNRTDGLSDRKRLSERLIEQYAHNAVR